MVYKIKNKSKETIEILGRKITPNTVFVTQNLAPYRRWIYNGYFKIINTNSEDEEITILPKHQFVAKTTKQAENKRVQQKIQALANINIDTVDQPETDEEQQVMALSVPKLKVFSERVPTQEDIDRQNFIKNFSFTSKKETKVKLVPAEEPKPELPTITYSLADAPKVEIDQITQMPITKFSSFSILDVSKEEPQNNLSIEDKPIVSNQVPIVQEQQSLKHTKKSFGIVYKQSSNSSDAIISKEEPSETVQNVLSKEEVVNLISTNVQETIQNIFAEQLKSNITNQFATLNKEKEKNEILQALFHFYLDKNISEQDLQYIKKFYSDIGPTRNMSDELKQELNNTTNYEELITVLLNSIYPTLFN